ncbi:MAG: AAA family ATPase [Acidobacteriota bacterium]
MDQDTAREHLERFVGSDVGHHTLGLVYGRRRIGKSTLLDELTSARGGFYWEATRGEAAVHLARLGAALGRHLGTGRLSFDTWEDAVAQLVRLGGEGAVPVVLDEFGYLLEAEPTLDSIVSAALGPAGRRRTPGRARLILCGSAIALMRALTAGEAPLRGRAGLEVVMQPFGYRRAARLLGGDPPLDLAARVYSVIGGVIGYYTDMVDHDLPEDRAEFDRWVVTRVLSPAATLHHEATTLLAEDPTLSSASPTMHHSILGAIANGSVTAGRIANRLRRPVSNLDPALKRLIDAGFVLRHEDPLRAQRPTYALSDPFLQFHYAILEPHGTLLRERDPRRTWEDRLAAVFDARVRGPVFEELARAWVRRHAAAATLGGVADHVGPSTVVIDRTRHELDVVAARADEPTTAPGERSVLALGEAKAGETVGATRLRHLEKARVALGTRATQARLLLFAPAFTAELQAIASGRDDVELVDLHRLYHGE